ncbi:MAG: NAD(P)H-dependent oxidoreductase [Lentisphaeria bacterium]|nr:NAD(P)H-dependent oxidoreductase [Lentisphaeria bacterium]
MKIFIVYWHAEEKSFNNAMFRTAEKNLQKYGHEVRVSDLNAMNFDPVVSRKSFKTVKDPVVFNPVQEAIFAAKNNGFAEPIAAEMEKIEWCELLIFQFPLWWFGMPAMIKGYVEQVFAPGKFFDSEHCYKNGFMKGRNAMLSITTGATADAYIKNGFNGDINAILRPIQRGIFEYCGFGVLRPQIVYAPTHIMYEQRVIELEKYAARLANIAGEMPIHVGEF